MNNENGKLIFVCTLLISIASAVFYVLIEENNATIAATRKCEAAGWVWLYNELKCIMVKEVK